MARKPYVYRDCKCGQHSGYRVMKRFGLSSPTWSQKPLYCYDCAMTRAMARRQVEIDERNDRIARGCPRDDDILQGLAEDIREFVARQLENAGHRDFARHVSSTPIIMNSQYSRLLGRAWYGENRRIEWSLKAYQNTPNITSGDFRQTILHEFAHILDYAENGRSSGHGRGWRRWTDFLGIGDAEATSAVYSSRRVRRMTHTEEMDRAVETERCSIY